MTDSIVKLDVDNSPNFKGYTASGKKTDPGNRAAIYETFDIGPEFAPESASNKSMAGFNVWPGPDVVPDFREVVVEY
jgi:isopenicillin N synthase-like dioxygenase